MNALFYACVYVLALYIRFVGVMFLLRVTYGRHMGFCEKGNCKKMILNEALNI